MANLKGNQLNILSFEQKLEIAKDWSINQQPWKKLAKNYKVSYSPAIKWALGYEEYGEEYLRKISARVGQCAGLSKGNKELISNSLRKELQELKKRNKLLEMGNDILKKFNQFLVDFEKPNK